MLPEQEDALDADAEALDEQPGEASDETHDDRGPTCATCGDLLPIGLAGKYCDDCVEPDHDLARVF